MRAVIQRVTSASVTVAGNVVGSAGRGLCVLVGISREDTQEDMDYIIRKVLAIRLFEDDAGKAWTKSVTDKDYDILCVSQFTLYASVNKGSKPDFHLAMGSDGSKEFYGRFLESIKKAYKPEKIQDGEFGAYMQVNIANDGPVTIQLDSRKDK
eukprot:Opistho-2@71003